ncbi:hypothetical protein MASR2M78_36170 [Treponema sp.]
MDGVLGLDMAGALEANEEIVEAPELVAKIEALLQERLLAKKEKNYARSDAIRNELKEKGILLEDSPTGTTWRRA